MTASLARQTIENTPTPRGFVQRALAGHTAIGLVACALLYLVCLTGMLAVAGERWNRWEQPQAPEMASASPEALQRGIDLTLRADTRPPALLALQLPTPALPRTVLIDGPRSRYLDASGTPGAAPEQRWTEFMLDMHYYLNLPATWGLLLTGALGVMMAAAAVTGVLAHPRIVRDAFRLRLRNTPASNATAMSQIAQADLHNRLGTWLLPFIVALAITGAMLGLGQIVFQSIASERYGGVVASTYAPLFGSAPPADPAPARAPRVDRAMRWMATHRPSLSPVYITITAPRTQGQRVDVLAVDPTRLGYGETYRFGGDGRFQDTAGIATGPAGQQMLSTIYKIHFGTFGGPAILIAWFAFGLALCAIVVTGTNLWLTKRARRGRPAPRLEAMWACAVWGSPILLATTSVLAIVIGPQAPVALVFWAGLVCALGFAGLFPFPQPAARLRSLLGPLLILLGAAHLVWIARSPAMLAGSPALIDITLILAGGLVVMPAIRRLARARTQPERIANTEMNDAGAY